jgi:hypothetical protein
MGHVQLKYGVRMMFSCLDPNQLAKAERLLGASAAVGRRSPSIKTSDLP